MIIVHHLENSRSQRILWLLEELGLEYEVRHYARDPETSLAPPELLQVHALGKSPVLEDDGKMIAESGAIIDYLCRLYGKDTFQMSTDDSAYQDYQYWLHYAEGSLMTPLLLRLVFMRIKTTKVPFFVKPIANGIADKVMESFVNPNIKRHISFVNEHLSNNEWFAGSRLTGADIQMSFPLEASLARGALDASHQSIADWVTRVQARPAYQRALKKGGPYDYTV